MRSALSLSCMESLKRNEDFRTCYRQGRSYANKYLVVYIIENDQNYNRIGISTSKKVGNSVVRHTIARLVREVYRLNERSIKGGKDYSLSPDSSSGEDAPLDVHYDIAVVGRRSANGATYHEIETSLLKNLHAAGLY